MVDHMSWSQLWKARLAAYTSKRMGCPSPLSCTFLLDTSNRMQEKIPLTIIRIVLGAIPCLCPIHLKLHSARLQPR